MSLETVDILESALAHWNIALSDGQRSQFETYANMLVEWNSTRMNLTRLTATQDIAISHFLDSLAITQVHAIPRGATLLDVGAGAGFPGVPIKILRPDLRVTLLEATRKKLLFCQALVEMCALTDIKMIHGRAEETGNPHGIRGIFDVVTARAVAPMHTLLPWTVPYLTPKGTLVAWKGPAALREIEDARDVVKQLRIKCRIAQVALPLSGEPERVHHYILCQRED